jgi:ubiquinone/menaquinone biosynthesis C-methylase UbiE
MWFDGQAVEFDHSAGLEPDAGRSIAQGILKLSGCKDDDSILDMGAGTGAVGLHFAELPNRYLGLDLSRPMLEIFRRKLEPLPSHMLLLQADSDSSWPIRDHALTVVFASRVAHHLQSQHFIGEVFRVCRPGGTLLLGQIRRDADSLPGRLQERKRSLLAEHGLPTRSASQVALQIADACRLRGATPLPATAVAQWTRTTTAGQLLAAWERKPQLHSLISGTRLDVEQTAAVVKTLAEWARQEFGGLDRPTVFYEAYVLQSIRLPG